MLSVSVRCGFLQDGVFIPLPNLYPQWDHYLTVVRRLPPLHDPLELCQLESSAPDRATHVHMVGEWRPDEAWPLPLPPHCLLGGTPELSDVDGRKNCLGRRIWKVLFACLDILGWPRSPRRQQQQHILLKIGKITNYIISHPQIAYKLIETGEAEEILQVQDLYINGLNNSEDITTQ